MLTKGESELRDDANLAVEKLHPENSDRALLLAFALRRAMPAGANSAQRKRSLSATARDEADELIEAAHREEFLSCATAAFARFEQRDILRRAVSYTNAASRETIEVSFLSLYSALESTLTFFRYEDKHKILARADFSLLERELKKWLRQHPLLRDDSARRSLIYEKIRELNRFPFSHVFEKFCRHHSVDLTDLWPVLGRRLEWPLCELRHRLVHGDPFVSRPLEALACAEAHLRWTVERMILSVLGWPVAKSRAGGDYLSNASESYRRWPSERARFA